MKIIITTTGEGLDSEMDPRFGRCAYFTLVDTETMAVESHANPAINAMGGAGSQAAQFIAKFAPQAVISGDFGPNAYMTLAAGEIAMYVNKAGGNAQRIVERFKAGEFEPVSAPTGPALHGGRGPR